MFSKIDRRITEAYLKMLKEAEERKNDSNMKNAAANLAAAAPGAAVMAGLGAGAGAVGAASNAALGVGKGISRTVDAGKSLVHGELGQSGKQLASAAGGAVKHAGQGALDAVHGAVAGVGGAGMVAANSLKDAANDAVDAMTSKDSAVNKGLKGFNNLVGNAVTSTIGAPVKAISKGIGYARNAIGKLDS